MITINKKTDCCACGACVQACPKQCISLQKDEEGFDYAKASASNCINCGLCEKVCPIINQFNSRDPLNILAAINKNDNVRMTSSSGGVFYLLAEKIIEENGVVFGARFNDNWQVIIDYADSFDKIKLFKGSKYVQASIGNTYKQCKDFLDEGRKVLFTGTPCQVAGLNHYLRKSYDNLLTVDFICHGVPSPRIWELYLVEVVENGLKAIKGINFRDKLFGWRRFGFSLKYKGDTRDITITVPHSKNIYMRAFLNNLITRPSCHNCKSKSGCSHADITLGDFWGINKINPEMYDNKGTSAVLCYTSKGSDFLKKCEFVYRTFDYDVIKKYNPSIINSSVEHKNRNSFFLNFNQKESIIKQLDKALYVPYHVRFKETVVRVLYNIYLGGVLYIQKIIKMKRKLI